MLLKPKYFSSKLALAALLIGSAPVYAGVYVEGKTPHGKQVNSCEVLPGVGLNLQGVALTRHETPLSYAGFNILEGPVWIDGALYYSNLGSRKVGDKTLSNQGTLWRWRPGSKPKVWLDDQQAGTNGLAVGPKGQLLAARQLDGAVVSIDRKSKKIQVLAGEYEDKRFNSPNDLAVAQDGTIYFSDPNWNTPSNVDPKAVQGGGAPGETTPGQRLYRLSPGGVVTALAITEQVKALRDKPNGVMLSVDERQLLVSGSQGLWVFELSGGFPVNPRQLLDTAVDGMGRDCLGNLYVTTARKSADLAVRHIVLVLDKSFKEIGEIEVPKVQLITNVAFGGDDYKTLFITTLGSNPAQCASDPCYVASLYSVALNVPGLPY